MNSARREFGKRTSSSSTSRAGASLVTGRGPLGPGLHFVVASNATRALVFPAHGPGDVHSPACRGSGRRQPANSGDHRRLAASRHPAPSESSPFRIWLRCTLTSLQGNRKTREGKGHPDRDAQFRHIHKRVTTFRRTRRPAISVDTKKKETLGNKANSGREYRPKGNPLDVDTHDFPDETKGKAIPYGVYDIGGNEAFVSIGISKDTAEFAVEAIRRWWMELGKARYPKPNRLLITADCGGSNGYRNRLWKFKLQELANKLGLVVEVCHYPPGTSKWNKVEHRLFCHITRNWRGVPLETHEIVVNLVSSTRTTEGLEVHCWLDASAYHTGRKVTNKEMQSIRIKRNAFHGEWNYEIHPAKSPPKR